MFIGIGKEGNVDPAFLGGLENKVFVVIFHSQFLGKHLSYRLTAAAVLTRDGYHKFIHIPPILQDMPS